MSLYKRLYDPDKQKMKAHRRLRKSLRKFRKYQKENRELELIKRWLKP